MMQSESNLYKQSNLGHLLIQDW